MLLRAARCACFRCARLAPACAPIPHPSHIRPVLARPQYIETFLVANLQSWVLAVLIVKNVLCIVGELVGLSGACMLGNAIKDRPVQAGAAVPMAVTAVSAVSSTEGAEAV